MVGGPHNLCGVSQEDDGVSALDVPQRKTTQQDANPGTSTCGWLAIDCVSSLGLSVTARGREVWGEGLG